MQYREEIDGLRALAIAPVVLYHAGVAGFGGGFVGVDIFFVISGYLITAIIARDIAAGGFRAALFYERRVRRIVPALIPVLAASTLAAWIVFIPQDFRQFTQAVTATALFGSNFLFAQKTDYFFSHEGFQPLLHGWSLSVEEQFYIVFPLFMALCARLGAKAMLGAVLLLLAASFTAAAWLASAQPQLAFFMLVTRMWELMAGAACALLPRRPQPRQWPALAGLALVAAGFVVIDCTVPAPGPMFAIPVIGTVLLVLFAGRHTLAGTILSWRPLVLLGLVSYGTYLWHQAILAFMRYAWFGTLPHLATATAIIASVTLGALSLWLIERPVRQRRMLSRRGALAMACAAGLGVAAIVGAAGHFELIGPKSTSQADRPDAVYAGLDLDDTVIPPRGPLPFVLFGDSHARQYYPALAARFGSGAMISQDGCLALAGLGNWQVPSDEKERCEAQLDALVDLLGKRKVKTLIWAQRWDRLVYDRKTGRELGMVSKRAWPEFEAALARTIAMLPDDVTLVIVGNSPTSWAAGPVLARGYMRCRAYVNVECPTAFPASMAEGRDVNPLLERFARSHPKVEFVDAAAALCSGKQCRILSGDTLYYSDGSHFTPAGARLVVSTIPEAFVR